MDGEPRRDDRVVSRSVTPSGVEQLKLTGPATAGGT